MSRKLATIATIEQINPHPNADLLELATVRGWQVVIKKGEFKPGDQAVYCEIDSVLPDRPEFAFLQERNFRIRTIKLRKELSQGILFPLSVLEQPFVEDGWADRLGFGWPEIVWDEGFDATELLGVTLYQPPMPACLAGDVEGPFPRFIPKTDCERIQNHVWILDELQETRWAATEKLDGSSCTVYWQDGELHVCSRNWRLQKQERNAFWKAAMALDLEERLRDIDLALQGELLGPGIQGNRYSLPDFTIYFFDACSLHEHRYLDIQEQRQMCHELRLPCVPLLSVDEPLRWASSELSGLLLAAEGMSALNTQVQREGVVFRPMNERTDSRIGRVAFKAISNRFLLSLRD